VDLPELQGLEIAARSRLEYRAGAWQVPSQTSARTYRVLLKPDGDTCACEDSSLNGGPPCKPIHAARIVRERDHGGATVRLDTEVLPKRPTYQQNWPAYHVAQATEKRRFQVLLADLCRTVSEPQRRPQRGPKPHLIRDALFAMALKVYCGFSGRRLGTDLDEAYAQGFISRTIPGVKVLAFLEDATLTPLLTDLIAQSAAPLAVVETEFAVDSSGFSSSRFERWYDAKYGVTRRQCLWVKVHIACGVKTNVVTAVRILDKDAADAPQFKPLVQTTRERFTVRAVAADKAYASTENLEAVHDAGGTGFIAFKANTTGAVGGLFEKMFHYFQYQRAEFLAHYHQRSNVESTFSAVKRKFGDSVRSKTDAAMVNEVLCKLLCHNLCGLIQEQEELGIVRVFWEDEPQDGQPDVLPLVRPR
jgi:hypothetical protein